jgi:muramoyltetrapeptide carboxypeptidase
MMMSRNLSIGFVAASSVVPRLELEAGVERLKREGFETFVHPHCFEAHFTFAGDDRQRADALWQVATDDRLGVVWMARGGYGAVRLLPLLDALTAQHGVPPRKLLVGYSDVTVLHEYVRTRWNWPTLHAPMPSAANFGSYDALHWRALMDLVRGVHPGRAWGERPLTWLRSPTTVEAELVGGNLAMWSSVVGTPYAPTPGRDRLVFFEDIGEKFYRIDRMLTQIRQGGLLDGAAALLLGDFRNCDDDPPQMVRGAGETKIPLRRQFTQSEAFDRIFTSLPIPVALGLPVGHGPHFAPLPLGGTYGVSTRGDIELIRWDWLQG